MNDLLTRATYSVSEEDLQWMVLQRQQLPEELRGFDPFREGVLDNAAVAEQGFSGNSVESLSSIGRITGYRREFAASGSMPILQDDADLMAATVVHLFRDEEAVSLWMTDVFLKQFEENVGKPAGPEQELIAAERLEVAGFHDEAVGLLVVQRGPEGTISSTIVDLRIGRLLGVAFVVTFGDHERKELTQRLGIELERRMVGVALGSA